MRAAFAPRWVEIISKALMGLALLTLPITSFPLLARLMGGTMVAPLSIVFVFLLGLLWFPFYLWRGGRLSRVAIPFLFFMLAVLLATTLGVFIQPAPYRGHTLLSEMPSALLTFLIGAAVYVMCAIWFREPDQFIWALRLLNISGGVSIVWSLAQWGVIYFGDGHYPEAMVAFGRLFSTQPISAYVYAQVTRVTGFAFEPSWLAHQLNITYLPFWLGATITGYSTQRKFWKISLENILLVLGSVVLFFSFSRVGMLALLIMLAFVFWNFNLWLAGRLKDAAIFRRFKLERIADKLLVVMGLILYALAALGVAYALSLFDPRMRNLFALREITTNVFDLARKINLAERVLFWAIGWRVFAKYPLFGVGLGNAGFYFQKYMFTIGYSLQESLGLMYYYDYLPNIKSLWVRLLAETGLVGFAFFVSWLIVLWMAAHALRASSSVLTRTLGWAGALVIIAFLIEGFSIDSFALPYIWTSLGLLTAATFMLHRAANKNILEKEA